MHSGHYFHCETNRRQRDIITYSLLGLLVLTHIETWVVWFMHDISGWYWRGTNSWSQKREVRVGDHKPRDRGEPWLSRRPRTLLHRTRTRALIRSIRRCVDPMVGAVVVSVAYKLMVGWSFIVSTAVQHNVSLIIRAVMHSDVNFCYECIPMCTDRLSIPQKSVIWEN